MAIIACLRNLYSKKVTPPLHQLNPIEQSTNPPTESASNDKSIGDNQNASKTPPCLGEIVLRSITSPSQHLPPAPPNTPRKKNWRRSIRDFIVGENGTLHFINEIVPSTPLLNSPTHQTSSSTPKLLPIYTAEMGLHSQPSTVQDSKSESTRPAVVSPHTNPGHEALDVLDQLSGVRHSFPIAQDRPARTANIKRDDSRTHIQPEREVTGTSFRANPSIAVLHLCAHDDPDSRNAGRSARHSSSVSPSSLTTSDASTCALPPSTSPSSTTSMAPKEEMREEEQNYASAHLDVYDRLWEGGSIRKHLGARGSVGDPNVRTKS
ncbi:hypothetical protein BST61_g3829 [Cercospora zeina]